MKYEYYEYIELQNINIIEKMVTTFILRFEVYIRLLNLDYTN